MALTDSPVRRWFRWSLTGLAALTHVVVVGGFVVWALNRVGGRDAVRFSPAVLLAAAAAATAAAASMPLALRWIVPAIRDLVEDPFNDSHAPIAAVRRSADGTDRPEQVLEATAETMRSMVGLGAVEIALGERPQASVERRPWERGALAIVGHLRPDPMTFPLTHGSRTYGSVRVSGLRRHGRLDAAQRRSVEELSDQLALVVASALLREELEGARERLVIAREEERRRLRRDLHDGLGPTLAAMKLHLAAVRRERVPATDGEADELASLSTSLRMATEEVRRLVEDLRPPMLDEFGLIEALRNLRFVPPDLIVDVVAPGAVILPAAAEVALYRIGAEALHNVVRHSRATRCELRLDVSGERVTLTVDDDGRGLPAWTAPRDTASRGRRHTGVGILAMRERAEELGGTVAVGPSGCGGRIVVASIPLDRSRAAAP